MRFAHLSDTHLGYRDLGILEREEDYYIEFERTVDRIIELDVDFVVHSGDLFQHSKPSTDPLLAFQKELIKLNKAGIPVYAISGNHDSRLRTKAKPPLLLFKQLGLNFITLKDNYFEKDNVLICGVPYRPSSKYDELIEMMNELAELAKNYDKSILLLHQGIIEWLPEGEINLEDLPKDFDYYAMGHLHNFHEEEYGKGYVIYPGSLELDNVNENFKKYGKGFCVVDLSGEKPVVDRIQMDLVRKKYVCTIKYNELDEKLAKLKDEIIQLDNPPLLDLTVEDGDFDGAQLREHIYDELGDYVLNLRTYFNPKSILTKNNKPPQVGEIDIKSLLSERVKEKYNSDETVRLSGDLLDQLSDGNIEDAIALSNDFFNNHYLTSDIHENKNNLDAFY